MANNLQLFKQKENEITQDTKITDSLIIKLFYPDHRGYKKLYGNNISNPFILQYLYKRFKDSSSIEETIKRIKLHIEEKPLCPTCGNPVNFIGKPSKMFTTYCSNQCAGKSPSVIEKKQHSDKLKNNGELGWVLSNKDSTKIENRKHTLLKKYGTTNVHSIEEIHEKAKQTSIEHYGTPYPMQNPEYAEKHWDTVIKNNPDGHWTSKPEKQIVIKRESCLLNQIKVSLPHAVMKNVRNKECLWALYNIGIGIKFQIKPNKHIKGNMVLNIICKTLLL